LNGLQEPSLTEFLSYKAETGQLSDQNPHKNTFVGQPHQDRGATVQFWTNRAPTPGRFTRAIVARPFRKGFHQGPGF
jgi:hypothetical protein